MVKLRMGYPDFESQVNLLRDRQAGNPIASVKRVTEAEELIQMQREAETVQVSDKILEYITTLSFETRKHPLTMLGVSPRGAIAVSSMAKAGAYIRGRDYVLTDDVTDIFKDVCAHRMILTSKAKITETTEADILDEILRNTPRPDRI